MFMMGKSYLARNKLYCYYIYPYGYLLRTHCVCAPRHASTRIGDAEAKIKDHAQRTYKKNECNIDSLNVLKWVIVGSSTTKHIRKQQSSKNRIILYLCALTHFGVKYCRAFLCYQFNSIGIFCWWKELYQNPARFIAVLTFFFHPRLRCKARHDFWNAKTKLITHPER